MPFVVQDSGFEYSLNKEIKKLIEIDSIKIGLIVSSEDKPLKIITPILRST